MKKNPFGDNEVPSIGKANPFGDDNENVTLEEAVIRIEMSARKIRNLRAQLGAEGLPLPAMRDLIDEVASGLEAAAKALRQDKS